MNSKEFNNFARSSPNVQFINAQKQANAFDLRYNTSSSSDKNWRDCSSVLPRNDFSKLMRERRN